MSGSGAGLADPEPGRRLPRWLERAAPALLGVLVAVTVCYPFVSGRLLLLDWVSGPHEGLLPPQAFGLGDGLTAGVPFTVVRLVLDHVAGLAGSWIPVVLFFPLATVAVARLVGGPLSTRLAAGLLYTVNPFVFDRLYAGDVALLLGYALLPLAVRALVDAAGDPRQVIRAAGWSAATVAMSVHFAWILVPIALGVVLVRRDVGGRVLARVGAAGIGAAALSCYLLVPPLLVGTSPSGAAGQLAAYRTTGDPRVGLFVNVAGLYGFFRPGPTEPKNLFAGWPAVLVALLVVVVAGYVAALRDKDRRRVAIVLLVAGVLGYFLALGDQGPTGPLFRLAYEHVPGFVVMREPGKFTALVALAYACGFGWGVQSVASAWSRADRFVPAVLALVLPLAYTPNLLGGLGGQLSASSVPSSWSTAAGIVGHGTALFLPWDEYFSTPFTSGRVIADPAPSYFEGPVVASENPGPGYSFVAEDPVHAYLDRIFAAPAHPTDAAALVGALGVQWIVLAKVADWRADSWVGSEPGISLAYSSPTLDLFAVTSVPAASADLARVLRVDPVEYQVAPGSPGVVALPVAYSPGWSLGSRQGEELPDGQLGIEVPRSGGTVGYGPFTGVLASELASVAVVLGMLAYALRQRRRRGTTSPSRDGGATT